MPYLIFQNHAGKETIALPDNGEIHIGRTNSSDITILDDPLVSRKQCMIHQYQDEAKFVLKDLGSSNGTIINGDTLSDEDCFLSEGDIIKVGNAEFVFCVENPERYQSTTTSIIKPDSSPLIRFPKIVDGDSRMTSEMTVPASQPVAAKPDRLVSMDVLRGLMMVLAASELLQTHQWVPKAFPDSAFWQYFQFHMVDQ